MKVLCQLNYKDLFYWLKNKPCEDIQICTRKSTKCCFSSYTNIYYTILDLFVSVILENKLSYEKRHTFNMLKTGADQLLSPGLAINRTERGLHFHS